MAVVIHLSVDNPFGQRLLQIIDQAIGVGGRLGIGAGQQLVENASGIRGSLRRGMGGLLRSHHAHRRRNSRQSLLDSDTPWPGLITVTPV